MSLVNFTHPTDIINNNNSIVGSTNNLMYPFTEEVKIGLAIYYCFVLIASLICNSALIAIIAKLKKLHTMSHLFFVNLSVSNIITSLVFLPFDIDEHLNGGLFPHGKLLCGIYKLSFLLCLSLSPINLLLLTGNAFITIAYPYKRSRLVNKRNVTVCLVLTYTYAVVYTLFPVFKNQGDSVVINPSCYVDLSHEYMYVYVSVNLFVPVVIIVALNIIMFSIANNQSKRIYSKTPQCLHKRLNVTASSSSAPYDDTSLSPTEVTSLQTDAFLSSSPNTTITSPFLPAKGSEAGFVSHYEVNTPPYDISSPSIEQNNRHKLLGRSVSMLVSENKPRTDSFRVKLQSSVSWRIGGGAPLFILNIKAAKRVAILVGECLFCWLFYIIVLFVNIAYHYDPVMTMIGNVINYSNIFLNPLVYGLCNPKIRQYIIKTFFAYRYDISSVLV